MFIQVVSHHFDKVQSVTALPRPAAGELWDTIAAEFNALMHFDKDSPHWRDPTVLKKRWSNLITGYNVSIAHGGGARTHGGQAAAACRCASDHFRAVAAMAALGFVRVVVLLAACIHVSNVAALCRCAGPLRYRDFGVPSRCTWVAEWRDPLFFPRVCSARTAD